MLGTAKEKMGAICDSSKEKADAQYQKCKAFCKDFTWRGCLESVRTSRKLVLFIVFVALFLDNMLITTVVPIIPDFLYYQRHPEELESNRIVVTLNRTVQLNSTTCMLNSTEVHIGLLKRTLEYYSSSELNQVTTDDAACKSNSSGAELVKTVTTNITKPRNNLSAMARHNELVDVNVEVGVLFASKSIMQLIANIFVGPLTNRVGYTVPMFTGFVIMFVSTIIFAFGTNYWVLFLARAVQGIGSACSSTCGMGMVAEYYPDDKERGNAMGIALGGLALGVLVGPPFGGVMYEFVGKEAPFLILASLALIDGCLQLCALQPKIKPESVVGTSLIQLLKDPYIVIAAGSITFANMGIAMLEPSLPVWMMDTMHSQKWEQGAAFLPASISYLIGTNIFGPLAHKIGRWLSAAIGMVVVGGCLIAVPFAKNLNHLIAPNGGLGLAIGMVDAAMMPLMGYLVDIRHASVYGSVYAIADIAFCLGFAVGPALSGSLVKAVGFNWMLYGIAIVNILYAPLLYFLRNPPTKEEKLSLIMNEQCPVQYVTYKQNGKVDEDDCEAMVDEQYDD